MVSDFARLSNESSVLELETRDLVVETFEAVKEAAVSEARHGRRTHPHEIHVAGEDGNVRVDEIRGFRSWSAARQQDVNN